jgi:hypothetical protein
MPTLEEFWGDQSQEFLADHQRKVRELVNDSEETRNVSPLRVGNLSNWCRTLVQIGTELEKRESQS